MEGGTKISNFKFVDFFSFLICDLQLKEVSSCWHMYGADYVNDLEIVCKWGVAVA